MGATHCCGDERHMTKVEKRRLLNGDDEGKFSFDMETPNGEEKKYASKKGSRVTFADPPDDSQPFEIINRQTSFITRQAGEVRGADFKISKCVQCQIYVHDWMKQSIVETCMNCSIVLGPNKGLCQIS